MFGSVYGDARMLNWPHWHRTPLPGIATTGLRRDKGGIYNNNNNNNNNAMTWGGKILRKVYENIAKELFSKFRWHLQMYIFNVTRLVTWN